MNGSNQTFAGMTRYRWVVCSMLFLATAINYMDRQVLSLTWKDFIAPEFGWNDTDYGLITGCFSIVYAIAMLVVGKFIDKVGARRGYLWAIGAAEPVHVADGGGRHVDGVYGQCLALSGCPLRTGHRGVGKLPGSH